MSTPDSRAAAFPPPEWTARTCELPPCACIHTIFEAWAARTPDAPAVVDGTRTLSYRELNERANRIAWFLRARGVGAGARVGICAERSLELIVGQLGILKAGGAYVPIDAEYPAERIRFMLEETDARLLLVHRASRAKLPPLASEIVCLEDDWPAIAAAPTLDPPNVTSESATAYVIYTSGSTGRPKGVLVPHRGTVRLAWRQDYVRFAPTDRFLVIASPSFDGIVFEIWTPLLNGAACVVHPGRWPELPALEKLIRASGVTCLFLTTSVFNRLVDLRPQVLATAREVVVGGEALSAEHIRRAMALLPEVQFINGYGPTECTTFACAYRIGPPGEWGCASVPIGRPLNNTECQIVDGQLRRVAIGEVGELLLGGAGLADGYLNHPEFTAEKFIRNPWSDDPAARFYRTGDLCRWLPDGSIEYIGRADEQIKLRGYRIEPGEVEAALRASADVANACVVAREFPDGRKQLVAFAVPRPGKTLSEAVLLRDLHTRLPEPLVPARIETIEQLPLAESGKVDRRALVARLAAADVPVGRRSGVAGGGLPAQLLEIWRDALQRSDLGLHSDFFREGGDSILAVQLSLELERSLGRPVPVGVIFACPTPESMANRLEAGAAEALRGSGPGAPLFYVPGLLGVGRIREALAERLSGVRRYFDGLHYPGLGPESAPLERMEDLAAALISHVNEIQPSGAVSFCGYSFGGVLAYEMARQLEAAGREVEVVVLGDAIPAGHLIGRGTWERRAVLLLDFLQPPWRETPRKFRRLADALRRRLPGASPVSAEERRMSAVEAAARRAYAAYVPGNYAGRVALLRCDVGRVSPYVRVPGADYGWSRYVSGQLSVHPVKCHHMELFDSKVSDTVADILAGK